MAIRAKSSIQQKLNLLGGNFSQGHQMDQIVTCFRINF